MSAAPARVVIAGQPFEILLVHGDEPALGLRSGGTKNVGRTVLHRQQVVLDDRQAPDQLRQIALHEVVHACLQLTEAAPADDDEAERVVSTLAFMLLQVIRDNPELIRWLAERASAEGGER